MSYFLNRIFPLVAGLFSGIVVGRFFENIFLKMMPPFASNETSGSFVYVFACVPVMMILSDFLTNKKLGDKWTSRKKK